MAIRRPPARPRVSTSTPRPTGRIEPELLLIGRCAAWDTERPARRVDTVEAALAELGRSEPALVAVAVPSRRHLDALRRLRAATAATLLVVTGPDPGSRLLAELYALAPLDHLEEPIVPEVLRARLALHLAASGHAASSRDAEVALAAAESRFRFLQSLDAATRDEADPERVMEVAAHRLGKHLAVSRCAYAHVSPDGDRFAIRHDYTDGCASSVGEYSLARFGPRAVEDLRAGRTLVLRDVEAELAADGGAEMFLAIQIRAVVCCALIKAGRLVALMAVHQTVPRSWQPDDVVLVQEVVERCWAHIERARSARELRASEERFRTLVTTTTAFVWTADAEGAITADNPSWAAFTGQSRDAYLGLGWLDAVHPEDRPLAAEVRDHTLTTYAPYEVSYRLLRRDGVYRHMLARAAPILDANGTLREWVGDCTDVTEQRAAEVYRLEQDRRKDQFIAMSAHELRNPLGPIRNAMHLLTLTRDEGTLERVRSMIGRQVDHLAHIVDDLLEMSRVNTGRVRLRRERLELGGLLRQIRDDGRLPFDRAGIGLTVELPDTPVWVEGDRTRLTQVFDNLLSNALKFTDPGGRVTARLAATGREATVRIRDTGIGIDPELLPQLFEPFTQGDRTLDRSLGGLGLGLAMVRGFVELHGGRVTACSDGVGRGTEVTVVLPRAEEPPALSAAPVLLARTRVARRVLVIEDNRDAADTLQLLLELCGCEVAVARTGPEGVARALAWAPDLVVCDIGLPGMNGYDVARRIRAELVDHPPHLVALTGYGEEDDRRRAREAGFDQHFTKPMDPDELQSLLVDGPLST